MMHDDEYMIHLPVSKSIGARYLVASCLAGTLSRCPEYDDSDDLRVIRRALAKIGECGSAVTDGVTDIDIHASGTAFRFVTAVAASMPGVRVRVGGTPRLCSRPMAPMLEVLRSAGAEIEANGADGTGPYLVHGKTLKGGEFSIRGDVSSQFVSALMLVAPTWVGGMRLRFTTPLVSRPYVEMTARVMRAFGIEVTLSDSEVVVAEGKYKAPEHFEVEADWSAAGFFYEAVSFGHDIYHIAFLTPPGESLQGDARTARFFEKLGVRSIFRDGFVEIQRYNELPDYVEADLSDNPDLAPAFAVACVFNACRFKFTGVRNLRVKECDRLAALKTEFERMGRPIEVGEDSIGWPGGAWSADDPIEIETYDDHRIAMAFAMAAFYRGEIFIRHPEVVEKSFAAFWEELPKIGLGCERQGDLMRVFISDCR